MCLKRTFGGVDEVVEGGLEEGDGAERGCVSVC